MSLRKLSPELAIKAEKELNEEPGRLEKDLKAIKEWISKQTHLNARLDDQWLVAFLRGCKFSLERTKEKLDTYYTMRSAVPEMTLPQDPKDPIVQEILSLGMMVPLPKTTKPDDPRVVLMRMGLNDANKIHVSQIMRVTQMITNIQLLEDDQSVVAGQLIVMDFSKITVSHMTQMTPSLVKKMTMCGQDAMPLRDKGSHSIHTLPGIETIFNIFKLFMSEKSKSRIFIHNEDMEALYKHVPREILPNEYGGTSGPIQDMIDQWKKRVENHRDWFLKDMEFKTDESKRIGKPKTAETLFGIEGSFRQLTVD